LHPFTTFALLTLLLLTPPPPPPLPPLACSCFARASIFPRTVPLPLRMLRRRLLLLSLLRRRRKLLLSCLVNVTQLV
jgi:hypothetical protein